MNNSIGMKQSELTPVYDALKSELAALPYDAFSRVTSTLEWMREKK